MRCASAHSTCVCDPIAHVRMPTCQTHTHTRTHIFTRKLRLEFGALCFRHNSWNGSRTYDVNGCEFLFVCRFAPVVARIYFSRFLLLYNIHSMLSFILYTFITLGFVLTPKGTWSYRLQHFYEYIYFSWRNSKTYKEKYAVRCTFTVLSIQIKGIQNILFTVSLKMQYNKRPIWF